MPDAVTDTEKPKGTARKRRTTSTGSKGRRASSSKSKPSSSPPNRVDPGWIHETIARGILKFTQWQAERNDIQLDVGKVDPEPGETVPEDTPEPVEVLSRVLAHIGHRTPVVNKLEKRLEGKEKSSGILSDLSALAVQMYQRNEDQIQLAAAQLAAAKTSKTAAPVAPQPESLFEPVPEDVPTDVNHDGGIH